MGLCSTCLHHAVIGWLAPCDLPQGSITLHHRKMDIFRAQPQEHLPSAAEFAELGNDQADGLLGPLIGVHLDPVFQRDLVVCERACRGQVMAALAGFAARLRDILETPLPMDPETRELEPRRLELTPEARALLVAFSDAIEAAQAPSGNLAHITGRASKAAEQTARIAGVLKQPAKLWSLTHGTGTRPNASRHDAGHPKRLGPLKRGPAHEPRCYKPGLASRARAATVAAKPA